MEVDNSGIFPMNRSPLIYLPTALAGLLVAAAPAAAQSFNCRHANSADERAICGSRSLSRLDVRLAWVFGHVYAAVAPREREELSRRETAWVGARRHCGGDEECLAGTYRSRIEELNAMLGDEAANPEAGAAAAVPRMADGRPARIVGSLDSGSTSPPAVAKRQAAAPATASAPARAAPPRPAGPPKQAATVRPAAVPPQATVRGTGPLAWEEPGPASAGSASADVEPEVTPAPHRSGSVGWRSAPPFMPGR